MIIAVICNVTERNPEPSSLPLLQWWHSRCSFTCS